MRVIRLTAANVKRLKAVEIEPNGDVVVVAGRNGQGKSSVLDAMWWALGGAGASKDSPRPVRDGADDAFAEVDLGDMIVRRTWSAGGKSTLNVRTRDGAKYPQPQRMLDELIGRLSFDPLEFARQSPRQQRDVLLGLIDLPFSLAEHEAERAAVFERRTDVNREVRRLEAAPLPLPGDADLPDEPSSAAELAERLAAAVDARNLVHRLEQAQIEAERAMMDAHAAYVAAQERYAEATERFESAERIADGAPDPDELREQLARVETRNREILDAQQRRRNAEALDVARDGAAQLTARLAEMDAHLREAIEDGVMPIQGLGFDEDGVTYRAIPFAQCSSAEQLRVSVAMAMAANPKLRVIRITDGSLLDRDSMAVIERLCADRDYQAWIERVDDTGEVGIVIEDGQVVRSD